MLAALRRDLKGFHFGLLIQLVLLSEIISACMNAVLSIIWWGTISTDLLLIGGVEAFVVSSLVGSLFLIFYGRLRLSEERSRKLIADASDGICVVDEEGALIDVNTRLEEFSGYGKAELLGMPLTRLHPPDERPLVTISFRSALAAGSGTLNDVNLLRKDGSLLPISVTGSSVSVNGRTIVQAIIRDVSEWKRVRDDLQIHQQHLERLVEERTLALSRTIGNLNREITAHRRDEEALRHAHDYAEAILDSMGDAVAIINTKDYTIAKVNSSFCGTYGIPRTEAVGRTCHAVIRGYGQACSQMGEQCPLMETVAAGGHALTERVHFRASGEMRYVEDATFPLHDEAGRICQVVHITRDITDRTLTELALRESEERFRQIFAQDADALFILEPHNHMILDANPCAIQTYGYAEEELLGRPVALLFDEQGYEQFMALIRRTAMEGTLQLSRVTHIRKDGSLLDVSLRGRVIRLKDRAVLYCSFRDMTEKLRLQEEAHQLQARLIHTNKMTSLGTLVSGVAHEINNPNNFILFNAQLLTETWRDIAVILESHRRTDADKDFTLGGLPYDEMREVVPKLLAGISDGSRRIKNIVTNLKDFARQDRTDLDAAVDVNEVITVSAAIMETHIKKHSTAFTLDLGSGLPAVRGSAQQLEQVVINLIMNALLALPGPDRGIRVATTASSPDAVLIRIQDEGVGMTPDVMDRIMEPFFTTRLDQGGTGLGLSISYSIIKAHGGSISFASEPGRGTTVSVILPAGTGGGSHA